MSSVPNQDFGKHLVRLYTLPWRISIEDIKRIIPNHEALTEADKLYIQTDVTHVLPWTYTTITNPAPTEELWKKGWKSVLIEHYGLSEVVDNNNTLLHPTNVMFCLKAGVPWAVWKLLGDLQWGENHG